MNCEVSTNWILPISRLCDAHLAEVLVFANPVPEYQSGLDFSRGALAKLPLKQGGGSRLGSGVGEPKSGRRMVGGFSAVTF